MDVDIKEKKSKKLKLSKLVGTFFRNALRSNLDLTSLADTKAGILISINGFILTVSVTASGFVIQNNMMTYAFISIILTSLGSIIFAVLAVKPRTKNKLVGKEHIDNYNSLLYYQDMADLAPKEYSKQMNRVLFSLDESKEEMITHLHILGAEIKKKYFWLKQAYTFFSLGLIVSATLIIYGLLYVEEKSFYDLSKGSVSYKEDKFYIDVLKILWKWLPKIVNWELFKMKWNSKIRKAYIEKRCNEWLEKLFINKESIEYDRKNNKIIYYFWSKSSAKEIDLNDVIKTWKIKIKEL